MASRKPRTVRVDPDVWEQFGEFVIETKGQKRGYMGEFVEKALKEYMDQDRTARTEETVRENNELLHRLISEQSGTHTHKRNDTEEKLNQIARKLSATDGPVIKNDRVIRAIENVAGVDERTIAKYRKQLKRQGLAYEHPGDSAVWTTDRDKWLGWTDSYLDTNFDYGIEDVIADYPIDYDDYINAVEELTGVKV